MRYLRLLKLLYATENNVLSPQNCKLKARAQKLNEDLELFAENFEEDESVCGEEAIEAPVQEVSGDGLPCFTDKKCSEDSLSIRCDSEKQETAESTSSKSRFLRLHRMACSPR